MTTTEAIRTQFRTVDGIRIRYAESDGPGERTVLLTCPWPESVYAFAPVWAALAAHARLFAIDLPGFGASERRDDLLSPRAMGGFLARLIDELELGSVHIVGPDVGTAAALFAAAELPELAELLPQITTPVTLVNGRHDRVVPLANAEFLAERLPRSRLAVIDAGHFVWEEAPAEYASIVIEAIQR